MTKVFTVKKGMKVKRIREDTKNLKAITYGKLYEVQRVWTNLSYQYFSVINNYGDRYNTRPCTDWWEPVDDTFTPDKEYEDLYD